ncbi:MAG: hypothetical protein P4L46_12695 [Fimbriimonas sp.]|nr:hypothetical protein [Fimbriimonas sp.]
MERKSKKEIKEALAKIREVHESSAPPEFKAPRVDGKKQQTTRLRKRDA